MFTVRMVCYVVVLRRVLILMFRLLLSRLVRSLLVLMRVVRMFVVTIVILLRRLVCRRPRVTRLMILMVKLVLLLSLVRKMVRVLSLRLVWVRLMVLTAFMLCTLGVRPMLVSQVVSLACVRLTLIGLVPTLVVFCVTVLRFNVVMMLLRRLLRLLTFRRLLPCVRLVYMSWLLLLLVSRMVVLCVMPLLVWFILLV